MTKTGKPHRMWVIRAGKDGRAHTLFVNKALIALADAQMGDLLKLEATREAFYAKYRKSHPSETKSGSAGIGGKFFRFIHEIAVGDVIVYPAISEKAVYIGVANGDYTFDGSSEYPHQRKVNWKHVIPKEEFSISAQYELGAARTFFEFKKNREELLNKVLSSTKYKFKNSSEKRS